MRKLMYLLGFIMLGFCGYTIASEKDANVEEKRPLITILKGGGGIWPTGEVIDDESSGN